MNKLDNQIERLKYVRPVTEVIEVDVNKILCGSNENVPDIPGVW